MARFPEAILDLLHKGKSVRIRAGMGRHRFIAIWVVTVSGRVFVRSWSVKPTGWYRAFVKTPRGAIQLKTRVIPVRAIRTRAVALKNAVDRAYLRKYSTPWELKYARDLGTAKSRATTIELRPYGHAS